MSSTTTTTAAAAATTSQPRLYDFHTTAYPAALNTSLLPERARTTATKRTTKAAAAAATRARRGDGTTSAGSTSAASPSAASVTTLTTNQLAGVMRELGWQLQRTRGADNNNKKSGDNDTTHACRMQKGKLLPAHIRCDERTTYRLDYCPANAAVEATSTANATRRTHAADDSRATHTTPTAQERKDVLASLRCPYLTLPASTMAAAPYAGMTVYRRAFMPDSDATSYRTVHHTVPRSTLGLSFAYSAYGIDDARRSVLYDRDLAQLGSTLQHNNNSSNSVRATGDATTTAAARRVHDALAELRAQRRSEAVARASRRQRARDVLADGGGHTKADKDDSDTLPSWEPSRREGDASQRLPYIALPRDAFLPHKINDV